MKKAFYFVLIIILFKIYKTGILYDKEDVIGIYKDSLKENLLDYNHIVDILSKVAIDYDSCCIFFYPTSRQGLSCYECESYNNIDLNKYLSKQDQLLIEKFSRNIDKNYVGIRFLRSKKNILLKFRFSYKNGEGNIIYIPKSVKIHTNDNYILIGNRYKVKTLEHFVENWYYYEPFLKNIPTEGF